MDRKAEEKVKWERCVLDTSHPKPLSVSGDSLHFNDEYMYIPTVKHKSIYFIQTDPHIHNSLSRPQVTLSLRTAVILTRCEFIQSKNVYLSKGNPNTAGLIYTSQIAS